MRTVSDDAQVSYVLTCRQEYSVLKCQSNSFELSTIAVTEWRDCFCDDDVFRVSSIWMNDAAA